MLAVLSGGAAVSLFQLVGKLVELRYSQRKSFREELKSEIARLEGHITSLEQKIDTLEAEIDSWKTRVDDWRNKYYALLEDFQLLKLASAAKDQRIVVLENDNKRLGNLLEDASQGEYGE